LAILATRKALSPFALNPTTTTNQTKDKRYAGIIYADQRATGDDMINAPEKIWDFWPIDGGEPVLWRSPCPFPADDACIVEYTRTSTRYTDLARIAELEGKLKLAASALDEASEYSSGLKSYADNLRAALKVTT
jgi:hypothetical protein